MSRNVRKNHAVLVVLIIAVIIAAVSFGCFMVEPYNDTIRKSWEKEKAQAEQDRVDMIDEYKQRDKKAQADWEAEKERILNPPEQPEENPEWPEPNAEGWDVVDLTDFPLENITREMKTRAELMNNGMLLVNEWHTRPGDFDESGIKTYSNYKSDLQKDETQKEKFEEIKKLQVDKHSIAMFPAAWDALLEAVSAAREEGLTFYTVSEGYRSWDDQSKLFQDKKEKLASKYSNEDDLIEATKKEVNYPGTSEFNSGLSFRLYTYEKGNDEFNKIKYSSTDQGIWMNENCWKYGLVFRFPLAEWPLSTTQDKKDITGVSVKLNLYRYVGKGNAAAMHCLDMCLEEYIDYLHKHPHIAVYENGELRYEIYCQAVDIEERKVDPFTIDLTPAASYVSSLDNMGYVVTVFEH